MSNEGDDLTEKSKGSKKTKSKKSKSKGTEKSEGSKKSKSKKEKINPQPQIRKKEKLIENNLSRHQKNLPKLLLLSQIGQRIWIMSPPRTRKPQ